MLKEYQKRVIAHWSAEFGLDKKDLVKLAMCANGIEETEENVELCLEECASM